MPKKTYKVGKEIYDIEESQSADFLKDVPSAIEVKSFLVGKDTFDIAVNEVNNFLRDVPSAKPLFEEPLKKKEPTYPGLKDAFGMSLRGPLMEKSNLQVTTKKEKQPLKSNLKAEELKSIETNLAKENIELSQIKQKLTALEKSGKLQDPTIQAEYNGLVGQYNEKQKAAKGQFDKYHKEHGNYRTIVRDEQNADLKKGINTAKGVLNKINTYDATLKQVGLRYGQTKVALEEAMQAGDNDAAAQLQGQLKKDEAIIANLGELIKTGKKVAAGQEQDSFGNNINIGIYQAFGTILQSPQGLTKAALTPIMEYGMGLDPVQRELMFRTLAQLNPNMAASETLAEFGGEISTKAEGRKQMANMNRLYGGSSYNALMKGDIVNAVSYAAKDFANSLPSSTLYATGAGAALMSAGMVGDEIRRTEEETGQAIGSKEILTASVKAGLEVVTERMFGDGKAAVELVKRLGKGGAEKAISDAVKEIARKGLGRKIAEQAGEEVVGESLNQLGANAADIYINGKKDISLWDGVGDAALIAFVGGGTYGGALTTANHYIDKARIKEAEDLKSQAANYMEQSMMQQNPAAAEVLEEKANTLNLEAQNIVDKEQEIALNANPETVDAIIALEGLKEQLEEALQEEGLPEEVAVVLEEKLSALQVEHNELIVQATKEAQQNIKAEEEEISEPIDVTEFLKGDTKEEDLTRPSVEVVEAPNETPKAGSVGVVDNPALKDIESTSEALDNLLGDNEIEFDKLAELAGEIFPTDVSYAYHKAKEDGSNPELVKAVEELLTNKKETPASESKSSEPSKSDKNYQEAQEANSIVSKENPDASVLIQPKGDNLSLTAVYVGKGKRGKGIGSKVLESVKKQADKLGKKVVLDATNELDSETDLERLGNLYEKNGFKKVGENKYEYDPKAKDSSGDIGSRADDSRAKKSDIAAGTNKGESSENVSVPNKKEDVKVVEKEEFEDAALNLATLDLEDSQVRYPNIEGKKQSNIGGGKEYDLYVIGRDDIPSSGSFEISIKDNDGETIGFIRATKSDNTISINLIHIKEENRGSGIGTNIYEKLLNDGYTIKSDKEITDSTYSLYTNLANNYGYERILYSDGRIGLRKPTEAKEEVKVEETPALKDVESTADALVNNLEGAKNIYNKFPKFGLDPFPKGIRGGKVTNIISEAYHKAKEDGSNPELVKAVEELLTNKQKQNESKRLLGPPALNDNKQQEFKDELIKRGLSESAADGSSRSLVKSLTDRDTAHDSLHLGNKNLRELWSKETGVKLPKTQKGTTEAIDLYFAEKNQDPLPMSMKSALELYDNDPVKLANANWEDLYDKIPEADDEIAKQVIKLTQDTLDEKGIEWRNQESQTREQAVSNLEGLKVKVEEEIEEQELTESEQEVVEEIKITKNEAKRAKSASPKRTRKSKDVAKVIENQAKDVEDSGDVEGARDVINSIETAEAAILNNTPVSDSFEKVHGISAVALAEEFNSMGKNADIFEAYEALTGKELGDSFRPSEETIKAISMFLEEIAKEGVKLKSFLGVENLVVNIEPKKANPIKKSGINALESIVSNDYIRPNLQSVYFEDGNMVATDANKLIVAKQVESDSEIIEKAKAIFVKNNSKIMGAAKAKQLADEKYKEVEKTGLNGRLINLKTGELEDSVYPKYKEVIPNNKYSTESIPIEYFIAIANGALNTLSKATSKSNPVIVVFDVNGPEGTIQIGLNAEFLLDSLQSLQALGSKSVEMSASTPNRAVNFKSDKGDLALVMPIIVDVEGGTPLASTAAIPIDVTISEKDKKELLDSLKAKEKKLKDSSERQELRERIKKLESYSPKKTDAAIAFLEKLKVDTKNKSFDAVLGIPVGIWNASIDTITLAVKAGVSISDAIKRGLNYIQKNHRGAWDKKGFNQKVLEELGLRGIEVNGEDLIVKPVEKEFASVVNGFYSDIEQSLLDTNKDNLSGKEWISTLGNSDEANWTGLTNWLNSQEGKVSKANIRTFLKENKIEVVEVVKSDDTKPKELQRFDEIISILNSRGYDIDVQDYATSDMNVRGVDDGKTFLEEDNGGFTNEELIKDGYVLKETHDEDVKLFEEAQKEAKQIRRLQQKENNLSTTQYEQYQLEGESKNYKEILVILPETQKSKNGVFQSSHFPEQNILVHLRMNTRYSTKENKDYLDPKTHKPNFDKGFELIDNGDNYQVKKIGSSSPYFNTYSKKTMSNNNMSINDLKKYLMDYNRLGKLHPDFVDNKKSGLVEVLFLEEIQSDWGQEGKKEGFKEDIKIPENLIRENDKGEWRIANIYDPKVKFKTRQEAENYYRENYKLGATQNIPSAPFVTDTNAWTKLGLKVALKEAVKQGADKIAWTTGEQQNARYDLRKQVDSINYLKNADGTYQVYGKKGDNIVFKEKALAENKLEASFGKDVAEKIINDKGDSKEGLATKVLEGENLAVGGKGMKGFYGSPTERAKATSLKVEKVGDKFKVGSIEFKNENEAKKYIDEYGLGIVGNVAKSLFKQEPGTVEISKGTDDLSKEEALKLLNQGEKVYTYVRGDIYRLYNEGDINEATNYHSKKGEAKSIQNSIDITPELKASVEGGLPLFGNVIQALERLKLDTKGKLNAFGIAPALWNAGIDTIILAIKGGTKLAEAVQKGIEYFKEKGAKFDEAKVTALLEEKVGLKRTQPKETNEKDNTEEPLLEGVQADRDEAKTGQDGPELRTDSKEKGERKIRRHFLTILNNASLKEATKFMLENDFAYNVKSMERSLSRAKAYLEKNGMEDSYNNFITYGTQIEGLTGDESIALAFLMQTIINEAVVREVKAGNQEVADELYDEFYRLSEKLSVIGTESGRVVNAFNLFLLDMSNPISAQMALNRIARKAENKAKASDSKERKKAESKTKAVKSEVDKGKRKASREVAEFAEDITKEDSELGDIIFKGSKKPISDEMKAKISDFFDNFIPDDEGMLYDGVLGVPLLAWKGFVIGVKKLVIEGSIPLVNAIKQQYDAMVGEYGKETMDKVSAEFQKRSGTTPKEITKKVVEAREAKSKKLNAEKFNLEKELQKERDRVAKLRAKEKESQQARIDEQSAKLKLQEAKEAQKAVEDKIEKDRTEKQKTLTQAKKEALKNELAAAKQKAKDAQKVLDLADKMALKTIQAELKEAQNKEKQLEKDIDKLGKELVRNRLFEDLVADLVDEYINMKGDTKNEDLIKLVEERLGVKGEKAVKIANKIRSSVYNNVTKRVSDRFEREIETERKRREGTLKKADKKSGEQIVDELVFAINSKMMTADMMMDLFPSKYGMVNFTAEDFQKVRELSQAIATAPSSERKAIAIKNFLEYLYSFKPYYFAELMNELWYFDVLSGVLTIGLQTGDVNNFYNFVQASAMAKEVPIVSALQSVRRAFEDKKIDYGVSALKDVLTGFKKGLIQTMVRPTANEVKTASAWIKFAFKNKAFLNESRSAFVESFLNGTASFTDFDNPFKNSALGEFDIRRVWDGAKKNKSEGKKGLAYLYWLAMENVYNVGAAAYRFITPFVNKIVPQVGKTLAAQDLFFTGIIKNTYSPFVLREQLRKEGLRGAELEAELAKRLYITEEELASARYTATNWRMKYDIGFSQNEKGEWNIYDNGKAVKKFSLGRFKTMNFATLEEAEDYAKTVVAPSGSRYRLDVISQLNLKRGMEALKAEKRIASFNLLTKASMGYTGTLLSALNSASNWLTKQSETISESASLKDSRAMRYGLNILATSVIYATHLFSFLKVGTGLARMFSQYYTPIGLARAVRADLQNKSLLGKELDENISKTEIDMLYAKALLGLIPTYFAAGMAQRLAELIKDDEDKDEEEKEVELTAQEKKFLELIEKKNGIKLTNEQKKVLTLVKPGDVVGNLQWMEAGMRRFYTNNKILVESSEFLGYDEQGNRMWSSLSAYPNYILAESIATAAWYMYFNKDNKESNPVTQFVLNPLYKFIDLSIGQGIVKYFASKTSTENKLEALAQTIVFDQLGVFNPNLLSGVMKYVDGKARKNENIFDYIDNQEDGSYPTAIGAYTLDKVIPLKGAWYEATQAPIVYGQFGEEIFRVPAEKQGYISAAIGYYKNKDKNPEQKAMNEFFLSIGINKLYVPDKSPIIDENFKPHKLTPRQRDEFGMLAGRVSFSQFKKLTPLIQEVYSKVSEKAAGDMVNKVFVSNYKNMAAFKLGLITQKDFDRISTENIASVIVKAVKSMNQSVLSEDVLEALEVTKEEKDFMENMKKVSGEDNKRAIFLKQMNQLKDETEMSDYLVRMYQLKIMSENMFNNLYNYKYLNGSIGANIPERIEEEENQEEED